MSIYLVVKCRVVFSCVLNKNSVLSSLYIHVCVYITLSQDQIFLREIQAERACRHKGSATH